MKLQFQGEVGIHVGNLFLEGELTIPVNANSIILFSHGSGSGRKSTRNKMVATHLQNNNFGTLLFDLLTAQEDRIYENRFNIPLLTTRLIGVTAWMENYPEAKDYNIGYFGASTGAASALRAAAYLPQIAAVVSRGGRPDLAMDMLHKVKSPALLIVGSLDTDVLHLNRLAYQQLGGIKKLEIIDGASHLFEEPGKLEEVAEIATTWFEKYLLPVKRYSE